MTAKSRLHIAGVALLAAACTPVRRPTTPPAPPAPTHRVGACADPTRDGVVGAAPQLRRADRDLDGDGTDEVVAADAGLCSREGNCYWNVFVADAAEHEGACTRYAGTIAGAALEPLDSRGEARFYDLRAWWSFGGGRLLVQEYRFRLGGYQITDALLCKKSDDSIVCED